MPKNELSAYKLFVLLSITVPQFSSNSVLAHNVESIVGGRYAKEEEFKYQAPIMARGLSSNFRNHVCGGAFVHKDLVVSAAHCFLENPGVLSDLAFSIIVATIDINDWDDIEIEIDLIFIPDYDNSFSLNDIAVSKLKLGVDFPRSEAAVKLDIPARGEIFNTSLGVVSGFGCIDFVRTIDPVSGAPKRSNEVYDGKLKYAYVRIISDEDCQNTYPVVIPAKQICGLVIPDKAGQISGMGNGDSGNPLVVGQKLVGIVSRSQPDCNDTVYGCIYTRVSAYEDIIRGLIDGKPFDSLPVSIFRNPSHRYFRSR